MGRRNSRRGRVVRDGATTPWKMDSTSQVLAVRNWDSDDIDPQTLAVDTVLEALEGLWMDIDDAALERDVNDRIAKIKAKIQEIL